ncbi:hypothetical protein [Arthrobacter sp. JSM 101049]|uniref:hypothetical protein n=1 Tax=Arthrobacter sp. JSM 101049 TaxID=929097 RepID=UPI0035662985
MSTKYNIQVTDARSAVTSARNEFDDLDGQEGRIEVAGEALANALEEDALNTALKQVFSDFLKPWTVTLVDHGNNLLNAADSIISEFVAADGDMEDSANKQHVRDIAKIIDTVDDTPDYDPKSSTSSTSAANTYGGANSSDGRYEW